MEKILQTKILGYSNDRFDLNKLTLKIDIKANNVQTDQVGLFHDFIVPKDQLFYNKRNISSDASLYRGTFVSHMEKERKGILTLLLAMVSCSCFFFT